MMKVTVMRQLQILKQAILSYLQQYNINIVWKDGLIENSLCSKFLEDKLGCSEYIFFYDLHDLIREYKSHSVDNLICTNKDVVLFEHNWTFDSLYKIDTGPYLKIMKKPDGGEVTVFMTNRSAEDFINMCKVEKKIYLEKSYNNIEYDRIYYSTSILSVDNTFVFKEEIGIDVMEIVYKENVNFLPTGPFIPYKIVNICIEECHPNNYFTTYIKNLIVKYFNNIDQQFKNALKKDRLHCKIFAEFCEKLLNEHKVPFKKYERVNLEFEF